LITEESQSTYPLIVLAEYPEVVKAVRVFGLGRLPKILPAADTLQRLSSVTSFALETELDATQSHFGFFTAPFRPTLVNLRISVGIPFIIDLALFPSLEHLAFYAGVSVRSYTFSLRGIVPFVVGSLTSATSHSTLKSFELRGRLFHHDKSDDCVTFAGPDDIPSFTAQILDALPPHLEHLSLTTSFLRPADVAAFLLGARRPTALRTLRIGDEVGRGLGAILRRDDGGDGDGSGSALSGEEEGFGALAGVLERAGVEVTTVE